MSIYSGILSLRKRVFDQICNELYDRFPIDADEITRVGGWLSFIAGWMILAKLYWIALSLVVGALILDALDGAYARRQGKNEPQVDWAMDRITEAVLSTALLIAVDGSWPAWLFVALFVVNNFLPIGKIPVLAHRWGICAYLIFLGIQG